MGTLGLGRGLLVMAVIQAHSLSEQLQGTTQPHNN